MEETNMKGKGFAVASLVTGILSIICLAFIVISIALAVCSIVFGIIAKNRGERSISKAGIALGIVSLIITFVLFLFLKVLHVSIFVIPSWYK